MKSFKIIEKKDKHIVVELNVDGVKKEVVYSTDPEEENILMCMNKEMERMGSAASSLKVLTKKNIGKELVIEKTVEVVTDAGHTKNIDRYEAKPK